MRFSQEVTRLLSALTLTMSAIPAHADPTPALPAPPPQAAAAKVDLQKLEASLFPADNQPLAFNHVVVPLEAFIIQRIQPAAGKFFPKGDVLTLVNARGESLTYAIAPNARDLFTYLKEKRYQVTVISGLDNVVVAKALASITLPRFKDISLDSFVKTAELDWTEKVNIKDYGDVNSTVVIGYEGLEIKPADQVIDSGPYYTPYTDYKSMLRFKQPTGEAAKMFAADEKSWEAERYKVARVLLALKETNKTDKATFQAKLKQLNKTSPVVLSQNGRQIADGKWVRLEFAWNLSKDKKTVEGCIVKDRVNGQTVQTAAIENCTGDLGSKAKFAIDAASQRVTSCDVLTTDGALIRRVSSPTLCLEGRKNLTYAKEYQSQQCSAFTNEGAYITTVNDASKCGKMNAIYDRAAKSWQHYESFAGMEKLTEKALLQRVSWGWDPRTPLRHPESLLSLVISNDDNAVKNALKPTCVEAVKKHIAAGYNLASKAVIANSLPVEKFPRPDVSDNDFFHYTESGTEFNAIMTKKSYADFFSWMRTRDTLWNWLLYVAGEDQSSNSYGNYGYKFKFKPGTRILYSQGDKPGMKSSSRTQIAADIAQELVVKTPELANCNYDMQYEVNFLTYLSAESSKIGAVAYWGIGNNVPGASGAGYQWLQVIDAWAIESMERIR